jgi:glycosyltransferase involved in cell wall biosynthesis
MPKILYLVTDDWFFASHFLPMAEAARDCDLEVVVAARVNLHGEILERAGCRVISLPIKRGKLQPFVVIKEIIAITRVIRLERPDIVHCIALRMVVFGGLISRVLRVRTSVLAITGLGTLWLNDSVTATSGRWAVRWLVRWLISQGAYVVFENHDDPREFGLKPDSPKTAILPGAGVDPESFQPSADPPAPPVKFAVISRMLRTKGIGEVIAAFLEARAENEEVELHLFGTTDPINWNSCTEHELHGWSGEPGIFWHGFAQDVAHVWRNHHAAVLLSYREGLPRTLIEAAASGRPIITTNVPGCREVVRDGIEGFLVQSHQTAGATKAILRIANDAALRSNMGKAANRRFCECFTTERVKKKLSVLYTTLTKKSN